jgi:broad specificity phosphatase PhoE
VNPVLKGARLALLFLVAQTSASTTLVFLRHGETLANSTGSYNSRTIDTFSPKGRTEVEDLTAWLERQPRFDIILVSPAARTLRTIAPYLRATYQRAVVWPLLYECCTGHRPPGAHPTHFGQGPRVKVPTDLEGLFLVGRFGDRMPISPDYDAGLAQVKAADSSFLTSVHASRVLVVGHSGMGGHFLHDLTGKWIKLDNAKPVTVTLP